MEGWFSLQLTIEGIAPEGALLRFQRENIPVAHVEKPDKRTLRLPKVTPYQLSPRQRAAS